MSHGPVVVFSRWGRFSLHVLDSEYLSCFKTIFKMTDCFPPTRVDYFYSAVDIWTELGLFNTVIWALFLLLFLRVVAFQNRVD